MNHHHKAKTVSRQFYLYYVNLYTWKDGLYFKSSTHIPSEYLHTMISVPYPNVHFVQLGPTSQMVHELITKYLLKTRYCSRDISNNPRVGTCAKLSPDWIITFQVRMTHVYLIFVLSPQRSFVKWTLAPVLNSPLSLFSTNMLACIVVSCVLLGCILTHLPLVPHICVSESGQHWFR